MNDPTFPQSIGGVWPPGNSISAQPRSYEDSPLSTSVRSISSGAGPLVSPALPNASLPRSGPSSTTSINRTEQVIQNFYSKCAQVIIQARWSHPYSGSSTPDSRRTSLTGQKKANKWFNLEMEDIEPVREEIRYWRSNAVNSPQPPPLTIDLFLDIGELDHEKVSLMVKDEQSRRQRVTRDLLQFIDPNSGEMGLKKTILLETWQLTLSHPVPSNPPDLAVIYKKSAMFFRSLYSFVRLMPAYRLFRRLTRNADSSLRVGYRLSTSRITPVDEAGLDLLHVGGDMRKGVSEYNFGTVDTPYGVFSLHVAWRLQCDFSVDEHDQLFNAKFTDMEENFFSSSRRSSVHAFTGRSVPSDRSTGQSSAPQRWSLPVGSPADPILRHRESDLATEQYAEPNVRPAYNQQSVRSASATGTSAPGRPLSTPPGQPASHFPVAARTPSVPVSRQHLFSPGPPPIPEGVAFPLEGEPGTSGSQGHPYVSRTGIIGGMRQMSHNSGGPRTIANPAMEFVSDFGSGDEIFGGSSGVSPISPRDLMFMGSGGQYVGSYPYQRSAKKTPSTSSLRGVLMVKNAAIAATQNTASYASSNSMTSSSQEGGLTGVGPGYVFGGTESMMPSSLEQQQPMAIPLGASSRFSPPAGSQPHPIAGLNQASSNPNRTSSSSRRSSFTFPIHDFPDLMKVPSASSVRGAVAAGVLTARSLSGSSNTGSPRLGVSISITGQNFMDITNQQRLYDSGSSMEFWGQGNQRGGGLTILENHRISLESPREDSELRYVMSGLSPPRGFQRDNAESWDSGPGSARESYGRSGTSSKRQSMLSIEQGAEGSGFVGRGGLSSAAMATSPGGSASYLLSGSMTESMLARRTKSKSALTRFQQLRDVNASFAENLLSSVLASEPEQLSPHSQQAHEPTYGSGLDLFSSSQPFAAISNQPISSSEPTNAGIRTALSPTSPLARNEPILYDADSDPSKERTDDSSATATTRPLDSEVVETGFLSPLDLAEQTLPSTTARVSAMHLSSVHGSTSSITSSIVSPPSTTSTSSKSTTGIEHDSDVSVRSGAARGLDQWSPTAERTAARFAVVEHAAQVEDARHMSVGGLVMEPEGTPSRTTTFESTFPASAALSPPRAVSPERTDDEDEDTALAVALTIGRPSGIPIEPRPRRRTATDGGIFDAHQHHADDAIVARKSYISMSMMVPNAAGRRWGGGGGGGGGLEQREEGDDGGRGWGGRRRPLSHHEGFTMMGIGSSVEDRGVHAQDRERRTSEEGNVAGATGDEDELIFRLSSFDLRGDGSA